MNPQFYKGFRKGMDDFGHDIARLINTTLMAITYIIGVGITAIFAKVAGKRFLKLESKEKTYWEDLDLEKKPMDEYYRQF